MAPKKGTKRTAAEASAPSEQQKLTSLLKSKGVTKTTYNGIVEAVNHPFANTLTDDVRKMLIAMIPDGVCTPTNDRHQVQDVAVRMLDEVYQSITDKMQAEIDAETSQLSSVEARKSELEAKISEAEGALKAAIEVTTARKNSLAEATEVVQNAKSTLAEKEKEQLEKDGAHMKAKSDHAALEAALSVDFRVLRDGDVESPEQAKTHYEKLESIVSTLGIEQSLLIALPACMKKTPSERGSFDTMVVAQLQEALGEKVLALAAVVAEGAPAAAIFQAAVDTAKSALDTAKEAQQAAAQTFNEAGELQKERENEDKAAKAALKEYEPEYRQASAARDDKVDQLQNFKDYNVSCFDLLRNREELNPAKKAKTSAEPSPEEAVARAADELRQAAAMEAAEAGA
eukprot:TRINITY_DN23371_c0_g1_i1.p1 TRINITY_DN23371_c0_g1~~TRINITY_DN23371_c0_g1_i1.p1  ORF type:complete len:400 (+),score=152.27 TRINITY_DN23371_c0_g1_i1:97-1296(+)